AWTFSYWASVSSFRCKGRRNHARENPASLAPAGAGPTRTGAVLVVEPAISVPLYSQRWLVSSGIGGQFGVGMGGQFRAESVGSLVPERAATFAAEWVVNFTGIRRGERRGWLYAKAMSIQPPSGC